MIKTVDGIRLTFDNGSIESLIKYEDYAIMNFKSGKIWILSSTSDNIYSSDYSKYYFQISIEEFNKI